MFPRRRWTSGTMTPCENEYLRARRRPARADPLPSSTLAWARTVGPVGLLRGVHGATSTSVGVVTDAFQLPRGIPGTEVCVVPFYHDVDGGADRGAGALVRGQQDSPLLYERVENCAALFILRLPSCCHCDAG